MPTLPAPALPTASLPVPGTLQGDTLERNRLLQTGSGVSQIHNPFARTAATVGDGLLSLLAPRAAQTIPGSNEHHQLLLAQQEQKIEQDQAQQQAAATLNHTLASTRVLNDQAAGAEAPVSPEVKYQETPQGLVAIRSGDTTATPVTVGGQPIGPKVTPITSPFELALRQNPSLTVADWDKIQSKPVSQDEATALNATLDPLLAKHGLPTGQFKPGMAHADTVQLQAALLGAVGKQQGDTHIVIQQAGQAAQQARNAPLDTADPDMAAAVQSVANGSAKLGDLFGRATTTAQKAKILAAVKQINPNFNSGDHDLENRARAYYTGGGGGGQTLTAFNTAQAHLDILRQAADALHNKDVTAFNKLGNAFSSATGDPAPTNFDAVKNAVKGEIARALTGHVTVSEQSELDKDFNSSMSPQQLAGVAHKYIQLIDGKKQAMQSNYAASQQGRPDFGTPSGPPAGAKVRDYTQLGGH